MSQNIGRTLSSSTYTKDPTFHLHQPPREPLRRHHRAEPREDDATQLKIQLLFSRLNKKRNTNTKNELERSSIYLSKSKTSKITFSNQRAEPTTSERLRQLRQRVQGQFQFQFEILAEDYKSVTHAHSDLADEKQQKMKAVQSQMATIATMLQRIKQTALNLTFSRKYLQIYSQILKKQEKKQKKAETPFRLSLTPFQKDNSLLISVKRNLDNIGAYNTTKKNQKECFQDYRSSEHFPGVAQNPSLENEKSSYKNFIKQTEQNEELNASFDVLEQSILGKLHIGAENHEKRLERSRLRIQSFIVQSDRLSADINEERKKYESQWMHLEAEIKSELGIIAESIDDSRRRSLSIEKEREQILFLMEQSVEDVLSNERKAYRCDHASIIEHLHEVISIFQ